MLPARMIVAGLVAATLSGCSFIAPKLPAAPATTSTTTAAVAVATPDPAVAATAVKRTVSGELRARGLGKNVPLDGAGVGWAVRDHVVVVSGTGSATAGTAADDAADDFKDLGAAIDHPDTRRILILMPKDSTQMRSWLGMSTPAHAAAFTFTATALHPAYVVIDPVWWNRDPTDHGRVISHELVHAEAGSSVQQPLWVVEGYAEWLSTALLHSKTVIFHAEPRLPQQKEFRGDALQMYRSYQLAAAFFQYLSLTYGHQKVAAFYRESRTRPATPAFAATFGVSLDTAVAAWQRGFSPFVTFAY